MDGENDEPTEVSNSDWNSHTAVLIGVWVFALIVFLVLPCFVNKKLRRVCLRRIKERRWNVEMDSELDESTWYVLARARYEAARQRAAELEARRRNGENPRLSKAEEESIRQEFLLEQLSKHSLTLGDRDFKKKQDTEVEGAKGFNYAIEEPEMDLEMGNVMEGEGNTENDVGVALSLPVSAFEESDTVVSILPGGVCIPAACGDQEAQKLSPVQKREVPNGCAICLSGFSTGEVITWAANDKCAHAFHNECILNWLLAVGRKKRRNHADEESHDDAIREALNFPMLCPCCRQSFVIAPSDTNSSVTHEETEEESSVGTTTERSLAEERSNAEEIAVSVSA